MTTVRYFPNITIRQSEAEAVRRLAEPIKDVLFPIIRMQAWPHPKKDAGGPLERSIDHIRDAYGNRPFGMDLAIPRPLTDKVYVSQDRARWAAQGYSELSELHDSSDGFLRWCNFISDDEQYIPVVQWTNDPVQMRTQVLRLLSLDRGLIFRFRRSYGWNIAVLSSLSDVDFGQAPILLIFDFEQIGLKDDLTVIGLGVQSAILSLSSQITGGIRTHVFTASSFPSEFTKTGEEFACLPILERQLFQMLQTSPALVAAGIDLQYGDHAAVFASDREPAFRGVPRVDYPTPGEWIYHRRREGFYNAASLVRIDPKWDEDNLCWGAQRIREAAAGQMDGLNAAGRWTTIRMNIHMHVQAQSAGGTLTTDEPWTD